MNLTHPLSPDARCIHCDRPGRDWACIWDVLGYSPLCNNCEETLVCGKGRSFCRRLRLVPCDVCGRDRSLRYLTMPAPTGNHAIEINLCARHLRDLLGRRLSRLAYGRLREQLAALNYGTHQVFLLQPAFYGIDGRARQPVSPVEEE